MIDDPKPDSFAAKMMHINLDFDDIVADDDDIVSPIDGSQCYRDGNHNLRTLVTSFLSLWPLALHSQLANLQLPLTEASLDQIQGDSKM